MYTLEVRGPFLRVILSLATALILEFYLYSSQHSSISLTHGVNPVKRSACLPASLCPWHHFWVGMKLCPTILDLDDSNNAALGAVVTRA